jgi:hypothetical protein
MKLLLHWVTYSKFCTQKRRILTFSIDLLSLCWRSLFWWWKQHVSLIHVTYQNAKYHNEEDHTVNFRHVVAYSYILLHVTYSFLVLLDQNLAYVLWRMSLGSFVTGRLVSGSVCVFNGSVATARVKCHQRQVSDILYNTWCNKFLVKCVSPRLLVIRN